MKTPRWVILVAVLCCLTPENSFAQPERVAQKTVTLRNLGPTFDYLCPAHSLSILKLKMTR